VCCSAWLLVSLVPAWLCVAARGCALRRVAVCCVAVCCGAWLCVAALGYLSLLSLRGCVLRRVAVRCGAWLCVVSLSSQCFLFFRISYCTTDKVQNKVFAYVAQNQTNGALECHAFLSPKKKLAQAVTLTVAQAFKVALDLWESGQEGKEHSTPRRETPCAQGGDTANTHAASDLQTHKPTSSMESADLLQLGESFGHLPSPGQTKKGVDGDDEFDDLDEAFSRLAKSIT
uniref:PID domain-containing protein n=1 Tax=Leptobrachium leishanense TaxID=445787 RepID=A0A8C5WDJ3_9ANUR